ncbi:hypothetical protein BCR44DRAFT_223899 [Catenaria anguillulae PL171]|uniref:Uncharacterized protein n=1 Tax=Catenaria anguillulae PL171 TaxID=765915 RepID=A0A1Y2HZ10_9FUNG|nr:hypothetical protein BCR44DRAFT_223899 [Catenaria anguillulae PL171]
MIFFSSGQVILGAVGILCCSTLWGGAACRRWCVESKLTGDRSKHCAEKGRAPWSRAKPSDSITSIRTYSLFLRAVCVWLAICLSVWLAGWGLARFQT